MIDTCAIARIADNQIAASYALCYMALNKKAKIMTMTDEQTHQNLLMKTGMLVEALPFMRLYSDKTILVKFGGSWWWAANW